MKNEDKISKEDKITFIKEEFFKDKDKYGKITSASVVCYLWDEKTSKGLIDYLYYGMKIEKGNIKKINKRV